MKLSIIIVSYNTSDLTCQCLRSIYSSEWSFSYEIILVDNNSNDNTLECVQHNFPDVRIIKNKENRLFAIANNQAATIAKGEYLLLLNSDTIVEDDNINKLVLYMDSLPERIVCLGPKILNHDRTLQSQGFMFRGSGGAVAQVLGLHKILPDILLKYFFPDGMPLSRPVARKVGWVSGCCMLVRSNYYKASGGLNEKLIFYGEEPEFSWRARSNKKETWYYPDVHIIHLGGASTDADWVKKIDIESHVLFVNLTTGFFCCFLESALCAGVDFIKFLLTCKRKYWIHLKEHGKYITTYIKATILHSFFHKKRHLPR